MSASLPDRSLLLKAAQLERRLRQVEGDVKDVPTQVTKIVHQVIDGGGGGGGGGGASAQLGTVLSYDSTTRLAAVQLDAGGTVLGSVQNYTAFPLNTGYRAAVLTADGGVPIVVGHQQVGQPPDPPPPAQPVVAPGFPLVIDTAGEYLYNRSRPLWCVDDDGVLGVGAGAIVVAHSNSGGGTVRVYDPADLNTFLTLPIIPMGLDVRLEEVFFFGGALWAVHGAGGLSTTARTLVRWDGSAWVTVANNVYPWSLCKVGTNLWFMAVGSVSSVTRIAASDVTTTHTVLSVSGLTAGYDHILAVAPGRMWLHANYSSGTNPRISYRNVSTGSTPFTGLSVPGLAQPSQVGNRHVVFEESGNYAYLHLGTGTSNLTVITTSGAAVPYSGVLPATAADGQPTQVRSLLSIGPGAFLAGGEVRKDAVTGNPADNGTYLPRIWAVSSTGSTVVWTGTEESTGYHLQRMLGSVAGGLNWVPGLEGQRLRWHVCYSSGLFGQLHSVLYEADLTW